MVDMELESQLFPDALACFDRAFITLTDPESPLAPSDPVIDSTHACAKPSDLHRSGASHGKSVPTTVAPSKRTTASAGNRVSKVKRKPLQPFDLPFARSDADPVQYRSLADQVCWLQYLKRPQKRPSAATSWQSTSKLSQSSSSLKSVKSGQTSRPDSKWRSRRQRPANAHTAMANEHPLPCFYDWMDAGVDLVAAVATDLPRPSVSLVQPESLATAPHQVKCAIPSVFELDWGTPREDLFWSVPDLRTDPTMDQVGDVPAPRDRVGGRCGQLEAEWTLLSEPIDKDLTEEEPDTAKDPVLDIDIDLGLDLDGWLAQQHLQLLPKQHQLATFSSPVTMLRHRQLDSAPCSPSRSAQLSRPVRVGGGTDLQSPPDSTIHGQEDEDEPHEEFHHQDTKCDADPLHRHTSLLMPSPVSKWRQSMMTGHSNPITDSSPPNSPRVRSLVKSLVVNA